MKTNITKILSVVSLLPILATPFLAGAQFTTTTPLNVTSVNAVYNLTLRILAYLQTFFWIIAAIMIVWAAFLYVTAGGDEEKVGTAKKILLYAVLAIVVALVSTAVTATVRSFLEGR